MEKSRQRRYPTVKSNLNLTREVFIGACSLFLWAYCAVVLFTFITIFIDKYNVITQMVLTIIKINTAEIKTFFMYLLICVPFIAVYLLISHSFNRFEVKKSEDN